MDEKYLLLTFNSVNHTMQLEKELKNLEKKFNSVKIEDDYVILKLENNQQQEKILCQW